MVSKNYLGIDIFSFAIITCKHIRSNTLTYGVCVSMYMCVCIIKRDYSMGCVLGWGGRVDETTNGPNSCY